MLFGGVFFIPTEGENQAARSSFFLCGTELFPHPSTSVSGGVSGGVVMLYSHCREPWRCPFLTVSHGHRGERYVRPASRAHVPSHGSQCSGVRAHVPPRALPPSLASENSNQTDASCDRSLRLGMAAKHLKVPPCP